jgi:hypothetical protein
MPRESVSYRITGVEPSYDAAWARAPRALRREFWRTVVALGLEVKDRELAAGLDAHGRPMHPLSKYTIEHRKSAMGPADPKAPPLTPAYGLSRTRSLLDGRAHDDYALFFWRTDKVTGRQWGQMMGWHRKGGPRLPPRDVIGLSPAGKAEVKRRAWEWWAARKREATPVPIPQQTPTPADATLVRRVPRHQPKRPERAVPKQNKRVSQTEINGNVYTLQTGSAAQINRAIGNGTFSGFRQVAPTANALRHYNPRYGRFQPPPPPPAAPAKPMPPRPSSPSSPATRPAKPAPDPLRPFREWTPAADLPTAEVFMRKHLRVNVVAHDDATGVFGTAHPDDATRLEHINAVTAEWVRLRLAFPRMPSSPVQTFYATDDARGRCTVPSLNPPGTPVKMTTKSREWSQQDRNRIAAWEKRVGRNHGTERQGTQIADNFRHELGHALTTKDALRDYNATVPDQATPLEWARQNLSEYAASDELESFAEAFGIFTRADYVAGTLPAKMEAFFRTLLGD